jgi:hypothetical protein
MSIDTSTFDELLDKSVITTLQKEVQTPMPEDGGGYTTEKNTMTLYSVKERLIKVSKVTNLGWCVWEYDTSGDEQTIADQLARYTDYWSAKRAARTRAAAISSGE